MEQEAEEEGANNNRKMLLPVHKSLTISFRIIFIFLHVQRKLLYCKELFILISPLWLPPPRSHLPVSGANMNNKQKLKYIQQCGKNSVKITL